MDQGDSIMLYVVQKVGWLVGFLRRQGPDGGLSSCNIFKTYL